MFMMPGELSRCEKRSVEVTGVKSALVDPLACSAGNTCVKSTLC